MTGMTDTEWAAVTSMLGTFAVGPGRVYDDGTDRAYRLLLGDRRPEELVVAIKRLVNEGQTFLPSPGEIVNRLDGAGADPTVPTAVEVVDTLDRGMWNGGRALARERGVPEAEATLTWVEENRHPWMAAFFSEYGLEALRMLPINDPDYGPLERDRLMKRWDDWLGRARERQAAGLPVGLTAVRKQLGMHKFDPLAALGIERPAELTEGGTDGD